MRLLGPVWLFLDNHPGCWVEKEMEAERPWEGVQVSRGEGMMACIWVEAVGWGVPEP